MILNFNFVKLRNSKLLSIIHHFNSSDWKKVMEFSESPYHNKNKYVRKIIGFLAQSKESLEDTTISKTQIWEGVFQDLPFKDLKFRQYMSLAFQCIEHYLINEELRKNKLSQHAYLLEALASRNMKSNYHLSFNKFSKLQNEAIKDSKYYLSAFRAGINSRRYNMNQNIRNPLDNFDDVSNNLDIHYLLNKLQIACAMLSAKSIYNVTYEDLDIKDIIQLMPDKLLNTPILSIYYQGLLLITNKDEHNYLTFKNLLFSSRNIVSDSDYELLYIIARNYCIKQVNNSNDKYISELFDLYKFGLEEHLLLNSKGQISAFAYVNIVNIALKLNHYDWTNQFIHNFKNLLMARIRDSYFGFNLAKYNFQIGELDAAQKLLNQIEFADIFINLSSKILFLKIFYETNEHDLLLAGIVSLKRFISREKSIKYHKSNYSLFLQVLQKITLHNPYEKNAKSKLISLINEDLNLIDRGWLREKIDQL